MCNNRYLYTFSQPESFRLVANHGEKVFYLLVIIGFLYTYKDLKGQFLIDVAILITALFLLLVIVGKFVSRVIWRFDVDFTKKKIIFYLCRKGFPIYVDFLDIHQIKVSGPIVFFVENKKYYYSTNEYEEILKILKNLKRITWGKMCNILGPNESIREIIDRQS